MILPNTIYKIKTTTGGFFFAPMVPDGARGVMEEEVMRELKKFCAKKEVQGNIITSVIELCAYNSGTPRVSFRDKKYRAMVDELLKTGSSEPWITPGMDCVFFFRCATPGMKVTSDRAKKFVELNGRACTVMEQIQERDFCGPEPWSYVQEHGGLYGICFEGEDEDYAVYGEELYPREDCVEVIPGFYRRADA